MNVLLGGTYAGAAAFPIDLIVPPEVKGKSEEIMKLNEGNFQGPIADKYADFIKTIYA